MIGRFETFTLAISEISQCWNKIAEEEMKAYELKGAYAIYLVALYRNSDGITAAELCSLCNKDKAEISRAVSVMEKKGLIKKEGAQYRAKIMLTEDGKKLSSRVRERVIIAVEAGGFGLSDEERDVFYHSLEVISSNLKKISKDGLPK